VDSLSLNYLSPESVKQVAGAMVKSWRFWFPFFSVLVLGYLSVLKIVGSVASKQTEKFLIELKTNTQARLSDTYKEMTNRINLEFQEPNISNIVVSVAQSEASDLMKKQVAPEIQKFNAALAQVGENFIENFYSNTVYETFSVTDTNRVAKRQITNNVWTVICMLASPAIPGSLTAVVNAQLPFSSQTVHPHTDPSSVNIIGFKLAGFDMQTLTLSLQYVRDARQTNNIVRKIELRGNEFYFDGHQALQGVDY
jgi:hypothetical protein